jgi:hypothetical protein
MTWFAFHGYGTIDLAGVQEKLAVSWGFHGYATERQANAHPNSVNILQKGIVNALEQDYQAAISTGSQPGGPNASSLGFTNPLSGLAAIGDFANRLTQKNTWIRVGEVIAGLILLYVGLNALARDTPVQQATQAATKGAKRTAEFIGAVPK